NRPRDDVPVLVDRDRNDRLDVEDVLRSLLGTEIEIGVVLERQADQVADGVLRELGQLLGAQVRMRSDRCQHRRAEQSSGLPLSLLFVRHGSTKELGAILADRPYVDRKHATVQSAARY